MDVRQTRSATRRKSEGNSQVLHSKPFKSGRHSTTGFSPQRRPLKPLSDKVKVKASMSDMAALQHKNEYAIMSTYDDICTDLLIDSIHLDFKTEKMSSEYYCKTIVI